MRWSRNAPILGAAVETARRHAVKGGQRGRPVEIGCSGLVGQLRRTDFPGPNRTLDVWALGADARIAVSERLGFEVSRWETSYANILPVDVNAEAWIFQTRVRLKF